MNIKKKTAAWLIAVSAAVMAWGCGGNASKEEAAGKTAAEAAVETAAEITGTTAKEASEKAAEITEETTAGMDGKTTAGGSAAGAAADAKGLLPDGQEPEEDGEAGPGEPVETDQNEAETQNPVEVFAEKVQEAVADRDMEALADLIEFPLTLVSTDKEKLVIAEREEFLKQNPDMIFGDDLLIAIANVDTAALTLKDGTVAMGDENSFLLYREIGSGVFGVTDIQE